ncbi:MAG TPA: deoxyguanosinetriphosphate triphosphohydrolase [Gammaproteobacteria bacterium]
MPDLAPYAAREETSRGRQYQEQSPDYRSEYQRDRDRIIHSAAFRRLEYKTQVFVNHEGDMFRTRLTHSIEVAQIGRTIARALWLNEDLTEAICLAHDLGHTPFGHAGQDILNECMKPFGGFEHNLQSLRVVDLLEERYADFPGLNLTFETREGILKHCSRKNAKILGDIGQRFLNNQQPGLEAQIANIADEIAYNNHDVDDGLRSGLINLHQLEEIDIFREQFHYVRETWPGLNGRRVSHEVIRRMINKLVTDLVTTSKQKIAHYHPDTINDVRNAGEPMIILGEETKDQHLQLKQFLRRELYQHHRVEKMTSLAKEKVRVLFAEYMQRPGLLPEDVQLRIKQSSGSGASMEAARITADYIAGMTDRFAIAEFERIRQTTD